MIFCIKLIWCPPKKNTSAASWQFVVHADRTTTKRGTFLEKTPQTILSWWNHFWNTNANFSVTLRTRKLQNKNLTQIWKKLIPTNLAVKIANTSKKKRSVSNFFRLYLNKNWGHCPRLVCTSPRVQFFSSLRRAEKQFWHRQGHQRPRFLIGSNIVVIQKTITAVSKVELQKRVNLEKTWTGISGFQMQSKNNFINAWEESWKTHKKRKYIYLHRENSSTEYKKSYG